MNNMRNKILSLLVLLLTAATGAWAEEKSETISTNTSQVEYTGEHFKITPNKQTDFLQVADLRYYDSGQVYFSVQTLDGQNISKLDLQISYIDDASIDNLSLSSGTKSYDNGVLTITNVNADHVQISLTEEDEFGFIEISSVTYYYEESAPDVEVTTNAASEGATFTEASFQMPAFDATADYELVRDMSVQMTATMGDGTDGVRYRVKKAQQGEGYEPADLNMMQVLALVAVNDGIEQKALTLNQDFFCRIYKLDEQTLQPVGDGMLLSEFNFAPGLYALKAFAQDGSDYDGETALSNTFKLFQGYPVTVAGGEYITYYSATENLKIENDDAQLYTITAVDGTKATAAEIPSANKEMPFLVYNKLQQEQEIVLIPTEDQIDQAVYSGFKGTAEGQQISSTATTDSYVMTGKQFVWLKDAGLIAAQRCWLEVPKTSAQSAPVIYIQTDGMSTGVKAIENGQLTIDNGDWYDLNGRKLQGKPQQKGVYILNGKKIVVR